MIIYTDVFCTNSEVRDYFSFTKPSLHNLRTFLESKTLGRYTVVEKAFLQELYELIDNNHRFSKALQQQLANSFDEFLVRNDQVRQKWSEHIKMFKL